jgi:hypothetical protein
MMALWGVLAALGALAFATASDWPRAWSIYLVNLVFWSGLAVTGPAIASMMQLTEARWSPSVRRLAVTTIGFLPVSFVLLALLFTGRTVLYPWVTQPIAVKAAWLNVPFFFGRQLVLTLILFAACYAFAGTLLRDSVPPDDERTRARRNRLAVIVLFLWLITVSLCGYFAVSTLYTAFCLLAILTIRANARGIASIPPAAVQDVAKLQFAMSIMWMYFFWSQYLVIWYGNVPVETRFVVQRFFAQPWQTVAWLVLIVGWLIPFAYLLKRLTGRPPERHAPLFVVAVFGLVAIFLERVLVVFPSVSAHTPVLLGVRDLAITVGFLALFALSRRWFMARYKPVLNLPHTGH